MRKWTLPTTIFIFVAVLVVLLDQVTKHIIRTYVELGTIVPIIGNLVTITVTHNTGASFSILTNYSFLLGVIAVFAIIAIILFYKKIPDDWRFAFALILGGAIGNLIDRIMFGAVTDFVDISIWPVFNLADAAITLAAILLIIAMWKEEKKIY